MAKITITIELSDEKLNALNRYLSKKNETVEDKLSEQMTKLYSAVVPAPVREFLDEADVPQKAKPQAKAIPRKTAKSEKTTEI